MRNPCCIQGCASPFVARGMCSVHYGRWRNHGDPLVSVERPSERERFWLHVNKDGPVMVHMESACWIWTAARNRGYGMFKTADHRMARAARYSFEAAFGPPDAPCVLHRCDNPSCVRPDHLWAGTVAQNNHDRSRKGRTNRVVDPEQHRGSKNGRAIFTEADARTVLRLRQQGMTAKQIADESGLALRRVQNVAYGNTWSHLLDGDALRVAVPD